MTSVVYPSSGSLTGGPSAPATLSSIGALTNKITWTYDTVGNRQTQKVFKNGSETDTTYIYNNKNQLTEYDNKSFSYDGAGNQIDRSGKTLVYDSAGRMVQAGDVYFYYGASGERYKRVGADGKVTQYITNGLGTLVELEALNTSSALKVRDQYALGAGGQIVRKREFSNQATPVPVKDTFYHQDRLGSVALLTDSKGMLVKKFHYLPFGAGLEGPDKGNKYRFTGQETDDELGLQYFHARWLDAEVGRFCQPDPFLVNVRKVQELNPYLYCQNNPINLLDPAGQDDTSNSNVDNSPSSSNEESSQPKAEEQVAQTANTTQSNQEKPKEEPYESPVAKATHVVEAVSTAVEIFAGIYLMPALAGVAYAVSFGAMLTVPSQMGDSPNTKELMANYEKNAAETQKAAAEKAAAPLDRGDMWSHPTPFWHPWDMKPSN